MFFTICLIAIILAVHSDNDRISKDQWNRGKCSCGSVWEFVNYSQGHHSSQDGYCFKCPHCGKVIVLTYNPTLDIETSKVISSHSMKTNNIKSPYDNSYFYKGKSNNPLIEGHRNRVWR